VLQVTAGAGRVGLRYGTGMGGRAAAAAAAAAAAQHRHRNPSHRASHVARGVGLDPCGVGLRPAGAVRCRRRGWAGCLSVVVGWTRWRRMRGWVKGGSGSDPPGHVNYTAKGLARQNEGIVMFTCAATTAAWAGYGAVHWYPNPKPAPPACPVPRTVSQTATARHPPANSVRSSSRSGQIRSARPGCRAPKSGQMNRTRLQGTEFWRMVWRAGGAGRREAGMDAVGTELARVVGNVEDEAVGLPCAHARSRSDGGRSSSG
jgi:hypothetical protein